MTYKIVSADGLFPQQQEACNSMANWLNSKDPEFTLQGFAGTGKTFTISAFIKKYCKNINYCVTAPTHKALQVIQQTLGIRGRTLHSLHGLRLNTDILNFDITKPNYDPLGTRHIENYKLIIIDEASMIPSGMFTLNRRAAKQFGVKILYLGDPLQLPPVNEKVGKVFTDVENTYSLTHVVRQSGDNDLLDLFDIVRADILNRTNNCVNKLSQCLNKDVSENYQVLSGGDFDFELLKFYNDPAFEKNVDFIRQACYTRNSVFKYNKDVRDDLVDSKDLLTINDFLTSYANRIDDDFKSMIICNSEDYIIDEIDKYVDDFGSRNYAVNLKSVLDKSVTKKLLILDHTDTISLNRFKEALSILHKKAVVNRGKAWNNYYKLRNSRLTMVDIPMDYNNKAIAGKDIDYGFALTIHKMQGSTFENVGVDLRNIIYPTNNRRYITDIDTRNRLLYVALSRAKNKALIKI